MIFYRHQKTLHKAGTESGKILRLLSVRVDDFVNLSQDFGQIGRCRGDDSSTDVFMVGICGQIGVMPGIVVTEDQRPICALVMIPIFELLNRPFDFDG